MTEVNNGGEWEGNGIIFGGRRENKTSPPGWEPIFNIDN